jgi:hypothetical protein
MRLALLALMIGLVGCSEEGPRTLRLVIDSDMFVPDQLDELRITVTASRTPEGNVCEPVTRQFRLGGQGDLPLRVSIEIGSEYSSWVAVRVVGRLATAEVFRRESRVPWPSSGTRDLPFSLDSNCYEPSCPEFEQCVDGACVGIPYPGIFDDLSYRDRGVPCDRAAEPEDVGTGDADAGD